MDSNILRIKRKATEAPLASLGKHLPGYNQCSSLTSCHVTQVIHESAERAKKRSKQNPDSDNANRGGGGVFMLAQTVSRNWAGVGQEAEAFRVSGLRLIHPLQY
jgi:hypothetical protein